MLKVLGSYVLQNNPQLAQRVDALRALPQAVGANPTMAAQLTRDAFTPSAGPSRRHQHDFNAKYPLLRF